MMKSTLKISFAAAVCSLVIAGAPAAHAKGCLKGAVVGGVAGHMAGHGVLGAAGGCAVGHHMANKAAQRDDSGSQHFSRSSDQENRY